MPDGDEWLHEASEAPPPSEISPDQVRSFRSQLTRGEDIVDPTTWAGSIPQVQGIAPRVRIGRSRWFNLLWLLPIGFVVLDRRRGGREGSAQHAVGGAVHRPLPRHHRDGQRQGGSWAADLGRSPALLQPVPVDLHHPVRSADPQ